MHYGNLQVEWLLVRKFNVSAIKYPKQTNEHVLHHIVVSHSTPLSSHVTEIPHPLTSYQAGTPERLFGHFIRFGNINCTVLD
jgi:hypothetical protein